MTRIYILGLACALVGGAYMWGRAMGQAECRAGHDAMILQQQRELIQQQEKIDAEVYGRGGDDIRRWLRAGYTIVD